MASAILRSAIARHSAEVNGDTGGGTLWKPGESGNPLGRPLGARNKLSQAVIQDIAADWALGGAGTLARVRMSDPATHFREVASIPPKDALADVQHSIPRNLD